MTLEELNLPYEFITVGAEEMKKPEYMAKQPWGKVPVLEDGSDFQLYESRAIIRYLVNSYDRTGTLYPSEPKARAIVDQWISIEQSYYCAAQEIAAELVFYPLFGQKSNEEKVKDAETRLIQALEVLDQRLAKSKFIAAEHFTIAGKLNYYSLVILNINANGHLDIVYLPDTQILMSRAPHIAELYKKFTNVMRWWQEISSRPTWRKVDAQSEFFPL